MKSKKLFNIALFTIALVITLPICFAEELVYDANGNLVTGDGYYREYNGFNQLEKIYAGSNNTGFLLEQYQYDPLEERVLTKWVYDDNNLQETVYYISKEWVQVQNSTGIYDYHYVYDGENLLAQINPDGTKYYYHPDHKGTPSAITDEAGNIVESNFYLPFGEVQSGGETSRYDYEGKELSNKLPEYDFHARKYNPALKIFTQPDTLLSNVYDPQNLNRYSFEKNNPYKYTDKDGHCVEDLCIGEALLAISIAEIVISGGLMIYKLSTNQATAADWASFIGFSAVTVLTGGLYTPLAATVEAGYFLVSAGVISDATSALELDKNNKKPKVPQSTENQLTQNLQTNVAPPNQNYNNQNILTPIMTYIGGLVHSLAENAKNTLDSWNGGSAFGGGAGCSGTGCQGQGGSIDPNTGKNSNDNKNR